MEKYRSRRQQPTEEAGSKDEKKDEFGTMSKVSLLDQHNELKKKAEGMCSVVLPTYALSAHHRYRIFREGGGGGGGGGGGAETSCLPTSIRQMHTPLAACADLKGGDFQKEGDVRITAPRSRPK